MRRAAQVGLLLVAALPALAAIPPARPGLPASEPQLWAQIDALFVPGTDDLASGAWFADAVARREQRLGLLQLYLQLYPGGAHRDEAVRRELATLFELAALGGGDVAALRQRADAYVTGRFPEPVQQEAAYWVLICQQVERAADAAAPPAVTQRPDELLTAYRTYTERYPRSRHTPRLLLSLFDEALRRGDGAEQQRLAEFAGRHWPGTRVAESLGAQRARMAAIGQFFPLELTDAAADAPDLADCAERPVLIVVWAAADAASVARLGELAAFQRENPRWCLIGVRVDSLGAVADGPGPWPGGPLVHDGRGWGTWFARRWGVRETPFVFVRDATGRLRGATGGDEWRELARAAQPPGTPTPSEPPRN